MTKEPAITGDPHIDARLEAWRPETHRTDPLDRLPAPGRERRTRIALVVLLLGAGAILVGYLAVALAGVVPPPG
jgi:hypothetical protein